MILTAIFLKAKLYILAIPFIFTIAGTSMNQVVLAANGGKFPVMLNESAADSWDIDEDGFIDDIHCRMTDQTRLNFLADYLNFQVVIMSPGDVFIGIGEILMEYAGVVWFTVVVLELNRRKE